MNPSEAFHDHISNGGEAKRELSKAERDAKNQRWSDLHYKLNKDENLSAEEKKRLQEEKEELRKEITQ